MNFRKRLNSIRENNDNYKISTQKKHEPEYILNEIVISYLKYLIAADLILDRIELVFSVENTRDNILEIIVKSPADNFTGTVIYYKYFPKKHGAIITIRKIQEIFRRGKFEIKHYENNPRYIRYYEKRFSVCIEFN